MLLLTAVAFITNIVYKVDPSVVFFFTLATIILQILT